MLQLIDTSSSPLVVNFTQKFNNSITNFFSDYTIRDFKNEKLPLEFVKVAEFKNLIGRALKLEKLMK